MAGRFHTRPGKRKNRNECEETEEMNTLTSLTVIFLGVRPASYTHNFTRGHKKLASVGPRDIKNSRM